MSWYDFDYTSIAIAATITNQCTEILCPPLHELINGSIEYSEIPRSDYELGTNATHECQYRYFLNGIKNRIRTCEQDDQNDTVGIWSQQPPTCDRMCACNFYDKAE